MGLNNNNIITQDGQNYIDMGGSAGSPFKIECNFPNPSGDLPASDVNIQINPRNQVVIGGGSSLNVGALTGVNTINGNVYPPPDLTIPIGSMLMWPVGSFALGARNVPPGYLVCDGSLLNISDYSVLAGLLGNTWSPFYPAGPADPTKFYLPNTTGRMAMGGVSTSYRVTAQYLNSYLFNVPGAPNRVGARFNNIQLANGAPGQLYVGMTASSPDTTTQISNIFLGGGGWNADVYVLFATGFVSTAIPGTIFTFDMTNPSGVPVIGLTNTIGGPACDGYGEPYRYQRETEVAVHTHQYNLGNGRTINQNNGDLIANNNQQTTGNPNNQFSIVGVGQVAEAYPQNPPNFGITYIIKAV
jgi:microcystin-dependent protein